MEQISQLLFGYVNGTLGPDEIDQLEKWANADPANRQMLQRLDKDEDLLADLQEWYAIPERSLIDDRRLYEEVMNHERRNRRHLLSRWLPYAAAAILLLAFGYFYFLSTPQNKEKALTLSEILPGGNRAMLTLTDGREIELSEAHGGIIIGEDIQYDDGSRIIDQEQISDERVHSSNSYYHLSTPKGGFYQVTLPDGSNVWLNADSKLKYPAKFEGRERVVELEGEAYFQVKPMLAKAQGSSVQEAVSSPFMVKTNNQTVEVLGTEFNISAYPKEKTTTTLVTGVVQVGVDQANKVNKLRPGQQSVLNGDDLTIQTVDVKRYIAWKDGKLVLEGRTLKEILKDVSRWYDVEIRYEGSVPKGTFFGRTNKSSNLATVLRLLESADMDYILEGRTLIVKERNINRK